MGRSFPFRQNLAEDVVMDFVAITFADHSLELTGYQARSAFYFRYDTPKQSRTWVHLLKQ